MILLLYINPETFTIIANARATRPATNIRNIVDPLREERRDICNEAIQAWVQRGDADRCIGTLRNTIAQQPDFVGSYRLELGKALASQGRYREASDVLWDATHSLEAGRVRNHHQNNVNAMVRIGYTFERAGRWADAKWAFTQTSLPTRREAYLWEISLGGSPYWAREYARILLAEDPTDAKAKEGLRQAEQKIRIAEADPERYPWSYDVPVGVLNPRERS